MHPGTCSFHEQKLETGVSSKRYYNVLETESWIPYAVLSWSALTCAAITVQQRVFLLTSSRQLGNMFREEQLIKEVFQMPVCFCTKNI